MLLCSTNICIIQIVAIAVLDFVWRGTYFDLFNSVCDFILAVTPTRIERHGSGRSIKTGVQI